MNGDCFLGSELKWAHELGPEMSERYVYGCEEIVRVFTASGSATRLTYPIAPGVTATYSSIAASEANSLGIAPSPVNTAFRQRTRNSSGLSPK